MDDRALIIIDASTLINFLAVDQVALLLASRRYRFVITEHVRHEITDQYPEQLSRLEAAIESGGIVESPVTAMNELAIFAQLSASGRLGAGECASIAAALERAFVLAIDDKRAAREARNLNAGIEIINTETLIVDFIRQGQLDIPAADEIKRNLETHHRFRLPFSSFRDVL